MKQEVAAIGPRPLGLDGDEPHREVPFVSAMAMSQVCTIVDAVDALEECLRSGFNPEDDLLRTGAQVPAGHLIMMPSALGCSVGLKLVSVAPGNQALGKPLVQAIYVLLNAATLVPLATFDGTYLTTLRTSAVSALVARHLARPDASRLALFGAGVQAWAHAQSLSQVLALRRIDVIGRTLGRAGELVDRIRRGLGIEASVATPESVAAADVVACCTTARTALFPGRLLRPGTTVIAIGAFEPDARELDDETLQRGRVVVESLLSALREAGDVIQAIDAGVLEQRDLITLRDIVCENLVLPENAIRVFKGTGMSWQDLSVAAMLHRRIAGHGIRG